jgi:hypothetical protein
MEGELDLLERLGRNVNYLFNFKKNIRDSWGQLLLLIIPILLAIPYTQKLFTSTWYYLIILIIPFLVGWSHTTSKSLSYIDLKKAFDKVEEERDSIRYDLEAVPERIIKSLFDYLNFGYSERITIYRFDEHCFVPVGRYAKNVEFKKNGRAQYPKGEGFINTAWVNGESMVRDLPDPISARKGYIRAVQDQCNIDEETLKNMTMKSRIYYCKNLLNINGEPIAVIVIESINPELPTDIEQTRDFLESSIGQLLSNSIRVNLPLGRV